MLQCHISNMDVNQCAWDSAYYLVDWAHGVCMSSIAQMRFRRPEQSGTRQILPVLNILKHCLEAHHLGNQVEATSASPACLQKR